MPDGFMAVRRLLCAWDDRDTLVQYLGQNGGEIYPHGTLGRDAAGNAQDNPPRCVSAKARPHPGKSDKPAANNESPNFYDDLVGDPATRASYEFAIVTATYATNIYTFDNIDGQLFSAKLEPAGEHFTATHEGLKWTSSSGKALKAGEAPGVFTSMLAYTLTFYDLAGTNMALTKAVTLMNSCNVSQFTGYGLPFDFLAETLYLVAPTFDRTFGFGNAGNWNLSLRFLYTPQGWNKFWRAETGKFEAIYNGNEDPINNPTGIARRAVAANFNGLVPWSA